MHNYILSAACHDEHGVKLLSREIGTTGVHKHEGSHKKTAADIATMPVTLPTKQSIADRAAEASVRGCLPLNFL